MNKPSKYFAFISYKREDEEWAVWLQHELEYYHLPASLNGREDLPKEFRPVFRDIDELKAGNLPEQIHEALASSSNLIVICSPRSAKSEWVNKEIESFIEIGKEKGVNHLEKVFPFIVDGTPHAEDETQECFPKALRNLPADEERIGGNVNESGRDKAFIKVMAGMLPNVSMDTLWNRYERDKAEEERRKREEKDRLLIMQSRLVSEEANKLIDEGDSYTAQRLIIEVLPKDLNRPDRPIIPETELALRIACSHQSAVLRGHTSSVRSVSYSPNGKYIVSTSRDKTARLWDAETGRELLSLKHSRFVNFAAFSPDGRFIATASNDKKIHIWDIHTGKEIKSLKGHSNFVISATFSPDGKRIVSTSKDDTVRIWDVETSKELFLLKVYGIKYAIFSPDGKQIYTTTARNYNNITDCSIWDADTGQEIPYSKEGTSSLFSNDLQTNGKGIVSSKGNTIRIIDNPTSKDIQISVDKTGVYCSAISPDGKLMVTKSRDLSVCIWDVTTESLLRTLNNRTKLSIVSGPFSPNGKRLATSSKTKSSILIWDTDTGEEIITIKGNIQDPIATTFSSDNKHFAFVNDNNVIHVWDIDNNKELPSFPSHSNSVYFIAFNPNGKHIATAESDKAIHIWDTKTCDELYTMRGHDDIVNFITFSPDGKQMVSTSTDNTIRIWDAVSGKELKSIEGHTDDVFTASFNHDGKYLVSASRDMSIRVWDIDSGKEIYTFFNHTSEINSVIFNPNGKQVICVSNDGTIRIWPFPPLQDLIDQTRERFKDRPLTPEERQLYYLE